MLSHYQLSINQDVFCALIEDLDPKNTLPNIDMTQATEYIAKILQQDVTAMLIDTNKSSVAQIICREDMVLCGVAWANEAFRLVAPDTELNWQYKDGDHVKAESVLVEINGNAQAILTAERTALNFLQLLSATATITAHYVKYLDNSNTQLLDTRKTIPYYRHAQKYAVTCGGGTNHRIGLHDAFLIKENHIKACGSIKLAVEKAKSLAPNKPVEVEVETIQELELAIDAGANIVMLDNFSTQQIQQSVSITNQRCKLEVSGNITETRLAELAATGVDYISTGAITKHVKAVDLSLLIL